MSIEQITHKETESKPVTLKFGPFVKHWKNDDEFVASMLKLEQMVAKSIKVKIDGPVEEAIRKALGEGYLLGEYWSHKSHYDGRPAAKSVKKAIEIAQSENIQIDKMAAPWAKSIMSGHQDSKLKLFSESLRPHIENDGLKLIDFSREEDKDRYGLERNLEEYEEEMKINLNSGNGFGLWPEATVRGGRKIKKSHKIHGLQPFKKASIRRMARLAIDQGKMPMLIPVATDNTHLILSPDTYLPPVLTVIRTAIPFLPNVPLEVRFGMPIKWDEFQFNLKKDGIYPNNDDAINDYFARQLAKIVKKEERGVYL